MRTKAACALGALLLVSACATGAPHHGRFAGRRGHGDHATREMSSEPRARSLFVSPMGEPFHANANGARGIDLWIAEADTDYDHRISHAEFMANADAFFAVLDANHDGAVTSLEDTALWARQAPEIIRDGYTGPPVEGNQQFGEHAHHDNNAEPTVEDGEYMLPDGSAVGHTRPQGAQAYGLLGDAEPVMSCDTNFDARVTRAEWDACAERRFVALDANHDGFIVPDEMHLWGSQAADQAVR